MAATATRMLLDLSRRTDRAAGRVELATTLVERASTAAPREGSR